MFEEAADKHSDPKWDFEPDTLTVDEGTPIIAVNQGGEPHTFTEVASFGGGFIPPLWKRKRGSCIYPWMRTTVVVK
jgi:hypothetical protein